MKMCAGAVIALIQWSPFFLSHQCVDHHQPGGSIRSHRIRQKVKKLSSHVHTMDSVPETLRAKLSVWQSFANFLKENIFIHSKS